MLDNVGFKLARVCRLRSFLFIMMFRKTYNSRNHTIATVKWLLLAFTVSCSFLAPPVLSSAADTLSKERQQELKYMVQQDCGSCHGMTLKGGLGPSLLPERIAILPEQYLIEAVTHGRPGTPMPPWAPILTDTEIRWIVEQLKSGQLAQSQSD